MFPGFRGVDQEYQEGQYEAKHISKDNTVTDTTIPDRTRALVERATSMRSQAVSHEWNKLWADMEQLDGEAGPGLAVGRYLLLPSGDGREPYIVDQIEEHRVHVNYMGIDDGPSAPAVDDGGWCLRSTAEAEIARRHSGHGTGESESIKDVDYGRPSFF